MAPRREPVAVCAERTNVLIDRELLRFEHPDQWCERPGWRERIKLSEHNLALIVGGYHLSRDLWQCGNEDMSRRLAFNATLSRRPP